MTKTATEKQAEEGSSVAGAYDFNALEERWRQRWLADKVHRAVGPGEEGFDPARPKCYILDMFPYPSGDGLHIGHPKGYIASDIFSRYKRMKGFNVLHPMGFDSFGLPAEQYALENNIHPAEATEANINKYRQQLQFLGLSFDWDREIATSRPEYYRWTQWIFVQLFDSWYDPEFEWTQEGGGGRMGRARPIAVLADKFASGKRVLTSVDRLAAGSDAVAWGEMSQAEQAHVLNNYRLAYEKEVTVNWCPGLGTVLSNEEVTNEGKSERGDFRVFKRPLKQWMMRITAYADRLLEDLDADDLPDGSGGIFGLQWPEPIKVMQRNWIGRSDGAEVIFEALAPASQDVASELVVFTTRPDTLFGATFMVVAPQHPLLQAGEDRFLVPEAWPDDTPESWKGEEAGRPLREAVSAYVAAAEAAQVGREEEREKTGVFTGIMARNPVNGAVIPVFVADYVSMEYGSGAIMAVPAHDDRDFEFATKFGVPIVRVVQGPDGNEECFTGDGTSVNSDTTHDGRPSPYAITGLATAEAKNRIVATLEAEGKGRRAVNYKLRDWIFSRQRYWGEPFPLAERSEGFSVATEVPTLLPEMDDFQPETSDDPQMAVSPPLSRAGDAWRQVLVDGHACQRELNVMPQWAGSCWYYLRFIDPANAAAFCDPVKESHFMPVDLYIGGAEHAVLHLLYARYWHKALFDLGHVSTSEPFRRYFNQGMITADAYTDERGVYIDIRDVELRDGIPVQVSTGKTLKTTAGKMGKRYRNGLPPEEVGAELGVDTFRLYEMYMGPLEASTPWSMEGIRGMQRFLFRVWRNFVDQERCSKTGGEASEDLLKLLHRTIAKVSDDVEGLRFNTAIASLIELNNELVSHDQVPVEVARIFLLLLAPFAPHIAEEIWDICGFGSGDLSLQSWPEADPGLIAAEVVVLPVQVNGKMRGTVEVPVGVDEEDLREMVLQVPGISRHVENPDKIRRFIVVPGKIVNIVV